MTEDGEKKMLELLTSINVRLARVETVVTWFRQREQRKADHLSKTLDDLQAAMPRLPK